MWFLWEIPDIEVQKPGPNATVPASSPRFGEETRFLEAPG